MGDDVRLDRLDDLEEEQDLRTNLMATTPSPEPTNRVLKLLRPSCLSLRKTAKLRSTSYLDGLRGVAAFIVYIAHSEAWSHDVNELQYGFGYQNHYAAITLPFIRVFVTGGHAAVAVFFVISGFVLSRRPLQLIQAQSDDIYPVLASAIFRRAVRLYLPFIAVTILFFTSWHVFGITLEWPKPQPTFLRECITWWNEFSLYVNPFKVPDETWFTYDFPLWTIPVEFQGSMLVYVLLLTLSRVTRRARVTVCGALALYFLHIGLWPMFCFASGLLLADLDVHHHCGSGRGRGSSSGGTVITTHRKPPSTSVTVAGLFVVGMYLASQPCLPDIAIAMGTPGFNWLSRLVPKQYLTTQWWRFWTSIAAPMLVYSTAQSPLFRASLESPVPQYLGRISFALYLVHMPLANTLGDVVYRAIGFVRPMTQVSAWDNLLAVPKIGPLGFELDFLVPQLIILPVTLYVSELVTSLLDEPSVTLGKRLYESVVVW